MTTDPFGLAARFLGIGPERARRFASADTDDPDLTAVSELLGIDLTTLSQLQDIDPEDSAWDLTLDADVSRLTDSQNASGRSRHRVGVRPGRRSRRTSSSENTPSSHGDWECPTCDRAFLSHQGLQRHYNTNPDHADTTVNAQTLEAASDKTQTKSEWVTFEDRIETFVMLPEDVTEDSLAVSHHSDKELVEISGAIEKTISTSDITGTTEDEVSWRVTGQYLIVLFAR